MDHTTMEYRPDCEGREMTKTSRKLQALYNLLATTILVQKEIN
jgi:hypothetical protein